MSRTRVRAEDLFCARCRRAVRLGAAHWPEGCLCAGCYAQALETYGTCTGCGVDRLTPGLAPDGGKLCTDCAGGLGDFTCERCGQEARRYRRGVCGRCVLAERLHALLDDGTGRIRPEFLPRRPRPSLRPAAHTDHRAQQRRRPARGRQSPRPARRPTVARSAPFDGMLLNYLGQRPNTKTATNPDARWLFPGRRAGQPMTPEAMAPRLRHLGFPTRPGRTAAIRQLVLQAPAPVIARMLGYNDDHTTRIAEEAGGTWRHYAPGDHAR